MDTKDKTTRRLEEYNDVFADIINVLVFNGERRVREDDLIDIDTKTEIVADDKGFRSQERDVSKFWVSHKIRLALFGLENQAAPDFQMPLRLYSYNGASYKAQIIPDKPRGKADEVLDEAASMDEQAPIPKQPFYPVLTLVLYFGIKPWDTAKSLYEAVNIPDEFKPFLICRSISSRLLGLQMKSSTNLKAISKSSHGSLSSTVFTETLISTCKTPSYSDALNMSWKPCEW